MNQSNKSNTSAKSNQMGRLMQFQGLPIFANGVMIAQGPNGVPIIGMPVMTPQGLRMMNPKQANK